MVEKEGSHINKWKFWAFCVERMHMTSWQPYWCSNKTAAMLVHQSNPVRVQLFMYTLYFIPIHLYGCWTREWIRSIGHVRYISILTWLWGFEDKLLYHLTHCFLSFHWPRPPRDLQQLPTNNDLLIRSIPFKRVLLQIIFCSCVIGAMLSREKWQIASLSCQDRSDQNMNTNLVIEW